MRGQAYAVTSGLLAAVASLCGKFAMARSEAEWLCVAFGEHLPFGDQSASHPVYGLCSRVVVIYLRIAFGIAMLLVNSVMMTTFVKALRFCSTSLEATVTNMAANFFFTAIFGQVLFEEALMVMWWIGTLLILFGLLLMNRTSQVTVDKSPLHSCYHRRQQPPSLSPD